jgi:toxin ParE1/3/4
MKIILSDFSKKKIADIYTFHKKKVNIKVANSIKSKILSRINELRTHPNLGQKELSLEGLTFHYLFLVIGNYKIIYRQAKDYILITDIFDVRQNPTKINKENR